MNSKRLILTKEQLDQIAEGLMRAEPKFAASVAGVVSKNCKRYQEMPPRGDDSPLMSRQVAEFFGRRPSMFS